jgi:Yersinia/Haemophilus virulence surface antigen
MPMKQVHEYSQSADKFEAEPDGVCQALSARWIVSRALWDPTRDGSWADGRWMGSKRDMEPHVWRTYRATRAARAAVAREERAAMEQAIKRFNAEKQELVARHKRAGRTLSELLQPGMDQAYTPGGHSPADLDRILAGIRIPTLPRMLGAVMSDIEEHGGLDGSLHLDRNVSSDRAQLNVCTLGSGYNLIDVRDSSLTGEGGAHAIAAEIRESETRLFDPNYGEWASVPPGNPRSSFGALLNFLLQSIYRLGSVQYLSVIHFPLKAGQR